MKKPNENITSINADIKQIIVVRKDLDLPKGKLCVQVAHAAVAAYIETSHKYPKWASEWLKRGQKKVVLKVSDQKELLSLYERLKAMNIPVVLITDAGLTVLPPNTITCIGIGPIPSNIIDPITRELKLL